MKKEKNTTNKFKQFFGKVSGFFKNVGTKISGFFKKLGVKIGDFYEYKFIYKRV